jgi:hypothetical protein
MSPPGAPVQQKCNFHYNKQQWTTQQLASAPTVCTATRNSEATATTRCHSGTGIHRRAKQQGGAGAGRGEPGAAATTDPLQWRLQYSSTNCKRVAMALTL